MSIGRARKYQGSRFPVEEDPLVGAIRRGYHWLMIWPCLWIGSWFFTEENWFSERATIHWLMSRKF